MSVCAICGRKSYRSRQEIGTFGQVRSAGIFDVIVTNDEQGMGQIKEICGNAGADIENGLETGTFPVSV